MYLLLKWHILIRLKKIAYKNINNPRSHFELVFLEDVLNSNPTDHSPFENYSISFYVILLITKTTEHTV